VGVVADAAIPGVRAAVTVDSPEKRRGGDIGL